MASARIPAVVQLEGGQYVDLFPVTAGQTFKAGALVVLTTGALVECGADPALILGIAMADASAGLATGGSIWGGTKIPVTVLAPSTQVLLSSATTPVYATHVGNPYGIAKDTYWKLDTTDAVNTRAVVVNVSNTPQQEGFIVRFLAANLQFDAVAS